MFRDKSVWLVTEQVMESVLPAAGKPSATGGTYNLTCIGRNSRISNGSKEYEDELDPPNSTTQRFSLTQSKS